MVTPSNTPLDTLQSNNDTSPILPENRMFKLQRDFYLFYFILFCIISWIELFISTSP